jgi:hypothetical protein
MGDQAKIIAHYPVDKLPADLRAGLAPGGHVTITVAPEAVASVKKRPFSDFYGTAGQSHTNPVEDIRKLRDEWDD